MKTYNNLPNKVKNQKGVLYFQYNVCCVLIMINIQIIILSAYIFLNSYKLLILILLIYI